MDEIRDMRPVYWVARGILVVEDGKRIHHYALQRRAFYDPDLAVALCRLFRRTYPDAIVVQECSA